MLKRTSSNLVTHKMTHCSTYTTPAYASTIVLAYCSFASIHTRLRSPYNVGASGALLKMTVFNAMRKTVLRFYTTLPRVISHLLTFSSLTFLMMVARWSTNTKATSQPHAPNC